MSKLNKDQKAILVMGAFVLAGVVLADFSLLWWSAACLVVAMALDIWLFLRNVQITIGRFTIGSPGTPRSR